MRPKGQTRVIPVKLRRRAQTKALGTDVLAPLSEPRPFLVHTLRLRSHKPLR
jgi:hypothetical protein